MLRQFCLLLATFIADICHIRLRYLSRSFYISVDCVLDVMQISPLCNAML